MKFVAGGTNGLGAGILVFLPASYDILGMNCEVAELISVHSEFILGYILMS
jgi:hypothetical protein